MRKIFKITMVLLTSMIVSTVNAQDLSEFQEEIDLGYRPQPYGFVQLQGGAGVTFTNVRFNKLITPTYSIGVGGMFDNYSGVRLHVNGYESKGGLNMADNSIESYKYKYLTSDLDLLVNFSNLLFKGNHHLFNAYLVAGVGLCYAWGNDDLENLIAGGNYTDDLTYAWGDKQVVRRNSLGHNFRAGVLLDFNIHKHWSVGLEVDANNMSDRFNSKYSNSNDWMLTAQLGVTYKFGFKKPRKPATPLVPATTEYVEEKVAEPVVAPKPEPVVVAPEPIHEEIFYVIKETTPMQDIINRAVAWAKKNPNLTMYIEGYADKGTGNATINAKYAQQRAENVAKALKEAGVPESQMVVKSYGDTVQPFAENDKNRCTIITSK